MTIKSKSYPVVLKMVAAVPKSTAITFTEEVAMAKTGNITLMALIDAKGPASTFCAGDLKKSIFKGDEVCLDQLSSSTPPANDIPSVPKADTVAIIDADEALRMFCAAKKTKNFPLFVTSKEVSASDVSDKVLCACIYSSSSYGVAIVDAEIKGEFSFAIDKSLATSMVKILAKTGNMEYRIQKQGNTLRFVQEDGIMILFDSVADPPALGEWAELPAPTKKVTCSGGFTDKFVVVEDDQLIDTADKKEGCFSTASMKGITNVMPAEEISSLNVYETNTRGYFYNTDGTACFICGKMR